MSHGIQPCASTNHFNDLAGSRRFISDQAFGCDSQNGNHRFIDGVADERLAAAVISSYCRRRLVEELSCIKATGSLSCTQRYIERQKEDYAK